MSRFKKEFLKFIAIGTLSSLVNYMVFFFSLKIASINYLIASAVGYFVGLFISYTGNRLWTFSQRHRSHTWEFILYCTVCMVSLLISLLSLKIQVAFFTIDPSIANIIAIGISAVCNFIGLRLFVFQSKESGGKTINPVL